MQNYCNIVKDKLNSIILGMEKNVSTFVVDSKKNLYPHYTINTFWYQLFFYFITLYVLLWFDYVLLL